MQGTWIWSLGQKDPLEKTTNWKILKEMGIPDHLTCPLRNLYAGQEATVRTGHGTRDWFQIGKGVRQHSSVLAWGIPGTGEPGGLPSMGLHRVRRDWRDLAVWEEKGQRRSNFWGSKTVSPVWDELRGKCQELVICDSRLQQVQKPAGGDASCFLKEIETSSV